MSLAEFKTKDNQHFAAGLHLAVLNRRNKFTAVWRPGTGAQFWWSGPYDEFKGVDQGHFDARLRLVSLSVGYTL